MVKEAGLHPDDLRRALGNDWLIGQSAGMMGA